MLDKCRLKARLVSEAMGLRHRLASKSSIDGINSTTQGWLSFARSFQA
jgi:hypothetical protein